MKDKTVDFGASDAYLSDAELAEMPAEVLHIPTCVGAVVLAYNLPEVSDLKLDGALVADIFLGKIKTWDDARIKALNPEIALPSRGITPVYRSDGSGTTFVFSDYLSKVSNDWNKEMGAGKALKWNTGIASKGNPGVAGTIQQTVGAIGYIGSEYALALDIKSASLQNQAGNFVKANTASISAAANADMPDDLRVMITNSPNPDAYPISCLTWILVYKKQGYDNKTSGQVRSIHSLLDYILSSEAQSVASQVHYAPLPASVVEKAKALYSK